MPKKLRPAAAGICAAAVPLLLIATVSGCGSHSNSAEGSSPAAQSGDDHSKLLVNPNDVWDTGAYSAGSLVRNPGGQNGVQNSWTHRDNSRVVKDTILIFSDPSAAAAALKKSEASLGDIVARATPQPAQIGTGGSIYTGNSPDGGKAVSVVLFAEGSATTTIEFDSALNDAPPLDAITEYGEKQDKALKDGAPK